MYWLSTITPLLFALGAVPQASAASVPIRGGGGSSLDARAAVQAAHKVDPDFMARRAAPYPQPLPGTTDVGIRDPTIVFNEVTQKYVIAGTGTHIPYWSAPKLTGPWSQSGSVLGKASIIGGPGSKGPWAPDIHYLNGQYYAYYTVSTINTQRSTIGVAVSTTGEADSFKDLGKMFASYEGNPQLPNALDPSYVEGGYLVYGSYFGGIYLAKLQGDLTSVAESSLPGTHIAGGDGRAVEGSIIYKKDGWNYLFVSQGQCCGFNNSDIPAKNTTEYKVRVGRAREVHGPYYDRDGKDMTQSGSGTVILNSFGQIYAPGGQSVYSDPNTGRDVMVFHYSDPNDPNSYATLGIYYLDFGSGWPKVTNE